MVWAGGVVFAVTRAGLGRVDSIGFILHVSTLRGGGRPTGGLNAELLCVLGVQSLPAAERHGLGADDASNRLIREEPLKDVEADVPARGTPRDKAALDVVPEREARATAERFELPPEVVATPAVLEHSRRLGPLHGGLRDLRRRRPDRRELHPPPPDSIDAPLGFDARLD